MLAKAHRKTRLAVTPICLLLALHCHAQSLTPRAYIVTPIHTNAVTLQYSLQDGNIVFDQTLPITGSKGRIGTESISLFHTLDFFGRSSNITAILPYAIGHFQANILGTEDKLYRSGLAAAELRFSVNLLGAPAMTPAEFHTWQQKTLIGASLTVSTPTGQYDPARLINIGENRWAFKPEIGLSQRWNNWIFDVYGAAWLFTPNDEYFSNAPGSKGPNRQTENPMGATEMHLSYDIRSRFWMSLDGNYWYGGETSLNGRPTPLTLQANSRIGATASVPITRHQSLKCSYSTGTFIRFGGDYQTVSAAWQYSWLGRPN